MRSAAAKSRRRRAAWRSSISRSISSTGTGGCASSARRRLTTPSTRSKSSNASLTTGDVAACRSAPASIAELSVAHQLEDRAERRRGVQIVLHRLGERLLRAAATRAVDARDAMPSRVTRVEPRQEVGQPLQRLLGAGQAVPGEVQLLAVVRRQQQVAHRRRPEALRDDVGNRVGVAERLRHLLLVDDQILDVHPEARERLAGRAFALRDLVLVVREDQVDAAGVDVDRRLAEQPQRHRRALEVPARAARRIDHVPGRLVRLGRLPQHEVARVFLGVVVGVDARARLHALVIEVRELAVGRQRRDLEVDRSVADVGVAVLLERADQVGHRLQVGLVGGARRLLDLLEAERARVLAEHRDVLIGVGAQLHARPSARR